MDKFIMQVQRIKSVSQKKEPDKMEAGRHHKKEISNELVQPSYHKRKRKSTITFSQCVK